MKKRWRERMLRKKLGLSLVAVSALAVLAGCNAGAADTDAGENTLVVWSFTDEIEDIVNNYYLEEYDDLDHDIQIVQFPTEEFERILDPLLGTGDEPDVILMEQNFAKKYVDSGFLADLDQFEGIREGSEMTYDYVKELGTSEDGTFVANAWQAAPGAFFYRYSLAEEYLGVSEPEEVQALMEDWDGFIDVARTLRDESDGEVYMIASVDDLRFAFLGGREEGWVVDDKLTIDPLVYDLLETSRVMNEEGLMLDAPASGAAYFAGMSSDDIFGYSLPTWALNFWLEPNGGDATGGDWRMVKGPSTYFRGGTWIGITEASDMKEEAAHLIEYATIDPQFLEQFANDTGDIVSNEEVVEDVRGDYSNDFLGGQNHYDAFAEMIPDVQAEFVTGYDQTINDLFMDHALTPYSKGEVDMDTAIGEFKQRVADFFPYVEVDLD